MRHTTTTFPEIELCTLWMDVDTEEQTSYYCVMKGLVMEAIIVQISANQHTSRVSDETHLFELGERAAICSSETKSEQ